MAPEERVRAAESLFQGYKGPGDVARSIGNQVVALLLAGRGVEDLSAEETQLLLRGYNWAGLREESYELAIAAVRKWGSERFLPALTTAHYNAFWWPGERFLSEADKLLAMSIGSHGHWHLQKASFLCMVATGEREMEEEWAIGDAIVNEEALRSAALELEAALSAGSTVHLHDAKGWNEQFKCVVSRPEYAHLRGCSGET
jgi:hypothetical protein